MEVTVKQQGEQSAEFTVPGGCGLCGNELSVRVSPAGAWAVCTQCRWIFHPQMKVHGNDVEMMVPAAAEA